MNDTFNDSVFVRLSKLYLTGDHCSVCSVLIRSNNSCLPLVLVDERETVIG